LREQITAERARAKAGARELAAAREELDYCDGRRAAGEGAAGTVLLAQANDFPGSFAGSTELPMTQPSGTDIFSRELQQPAGPFRWAAIPRVLVQNSNGSVRQTLLGEHLGRTKEEAEARAQETLNKWRKTNTKT